MDDLVWALKRNRVAVMYIHKYSNKQADVEQTTRSVRWYIHKEEASKLSISHTGVVRVPVGI